MQRKTDTKGWGLSQIPLMKQTKLDRKGNRRVKESPKVIIVLHTYNIIIFFKLSFQMLFSIQFVLSQYIYLYRQIMPKMMCLCLWQHALLCSCLPKSSSLNISMPLCSRKLNRLNEQAKNKPSHLNGITCKAIFKTA